MKATTNSRFRDLYYKQQLSTKRIRDALNDADVEATEEDIKAYLMDPHEPGFQPMPDSIFDTIQHEFSDYADPMEPERKD